MKPDRVIQLVNLSRNLATELQKASLEYEDSGNPKAASLANDALVHVSRFHSSMVALDKIINQGEYTDHGRTD